MSQSTYARIENGESNSWSLHLDKITEFFEIKPEELFDEENVVINFNQQGGQFNNAIIINQLSEKLIEQYEKNILLYEDRFIEKHTLIKSLQEQNNYLKEEIELLKKKY